MKTLEAPGLDVIESEEQCILILYFVHLSILWLIPVCNAMYDLCHQLVQPSSKLVREIKVILLAVQAIIAIV